MNEAIKSILAFFIENVYFGGPFAASALVLYRLFNWYFTLRKKFRADAIEQLEFKIKEKQLKHAFDSDTQDT